MKVALYARNSKPPRDWKPAKPGDEPPGSWVQQLQELEAWAQRNGHDVVAKHYDAQVSGKDGNRPGWKEVMKLVRANHVQAVAAVKLDRVMRSNVHFYQAVQEFRHVQLVFTQQGLTIGDQNPMTKAMVGFLSLMAELERDWAYERQAAVMRVGGDGKTYGPRSDKPAGRPVGFGDDHKFRKRGNRMEHDRARCRACRGGKGGLNPPLSAVAEKGGLGETGGFPTPSDRQKTRPSENPELALTNPPSENGSAAGDAATRMGYDSPPGGSA